MIERVIADWLTNATERDYQKPFAQVLLAEGHEILYVSRHSQMEQGKDIITRTPSGELQAFQLKRGDIGTAEWRAIRGEVVDLQNLPIAVPLVDKHQSYGSFLVTNGEVTDPVRRAIDDENQVASARGLPEVGIIQADALVQRFVNVTGSFLPHDIPDMGRLLDLMRRNGQDFLDKPSLFDFLMHTFFRPGKKPKKGEALQAVASSAVVLGYLLAPYQRAKNHYALFEAWTMLASTILWYGRATGLSRAVYEKTFSLAVEEAGNSLRALVGEVLERENYLEGDGMGDGGHIYRIRASICLGAVACSVLSDCAAGAPVASGETSRRVLDRALDDERRMLSVGDAMAPHVLITILFLETMARRDAAERILSRHIKEMSSTLSHSSDGGLPNPYLSHDRVALAHQRQVSRIMGLAREFDEELDIDFAQFSAASWALEGFVQMAARRGMRGTLEECWRDISHLQYEEFRPPTDTDCLLYECDRGNTIAWFPTPTQSWQNLEEQSSVADVPDWAAEYPAFLLMFALVFPHRCNARLVRAIDRIVSEISLGELRGRQEADVDVGKVKNV